MPPPAVSRRDALEAMLRAHPPADDTERAHLDRMSALLRTEGDPFARDHWAPGHFTASAFVLSPGGDALLLIFHEKLERWLQPGGHVDPDDADLVEAARREVREETGLDALTLAHVGAFDADVHLIPARKADPAHEHFDVRFLFRASTSRVVAASDAREARWYGLDDLGRIHTDASVMRAVEKLAKRSR